MLPKLWVLSAAWVTPTTGTGQAEWDSPLWSQHLCHLETCEKYKFLGPNPHLLNRKLGVGPSHLHLNKPPGRLVPIKVIWDHDESLRTLSLSFPPV